MEAIQNQLPTGLRRGVRLLARTIKAFGDDDCALRAAALGYHVLLSFFPMVLFLLFITSVVISTGDTRTVLLDFVHRAVPELAEPATYLIDRTISASAPFGLLGAAGLLWSASAMFSVLASTFSIIWQAKPRSLWRRRLMGLLTVLALAILFIFSIALRTFSAFDLNDFLPISQRWANTGIDFLITSALLLVLYTWLPNRSINLKAALSGALLAAALWQIAKTAFSWYLSFGLDRFGAIYGSLGSVIILVLWVYFSSSILFFGAEFAAELQLSYMPAEQ
jgi:membrane protein